MTTTSQSHTFVPSLSSGPEPLVDECSKETEGAIDQHTNMSSEIATGDRSNVTTPGNELPGAFPRTPEVSSTSTNTDKDTAQGAYVAAHHKIEGAYLAAQHGVEGVYATAEHAARQYLPTSVVDTLEGAGVLRENPEHNDKPSSPTHNSKSSNTSTTGGGIGPLPGNNNTEENIPQRRSAGNTGNGGGVMSIGASHPTQHAYKPSPLSTTASASPPITPDTPYSTPSRKEANNLSIAANPSPGMNPFTTTQPESTTNPRMNTNPFRNENFATTGSPQLSPASSTGTLTSPDRDAQTAAHAVRDTTSGMDKGIDTGAETTSRTAADAKDTPNGNSDTGKDMKANVSPPYRMEGDDNAQHGADAGSNSSSGDALAQEDGAEKGNGSRGHTRKLSFVQKMKGEAKALAEKVKTKTRG